MWFKDAGVVANLSLRSPQLMPLLLRGLSLSNPTQLKVVSPRSTLPAVRTFMLQNSATSEIADAVGLH